jgi:hypothetical protein
MTASVCALTTRAVVAALFWTSVLASFCEVFTHSNPELTEHLQTMSELEFFMSNHSLHDTMRVKLRDHFLHRKHVRMAVRADRVTKQMSADLQTEVMFLVYGGWMSQIPFLRGCEKSCIVQVAMAMHPDVFAPSESPPGRHFYVLKSGLVAYGKAMLSKGKTWGEEIITSSLDERYAARCLTYAATADTAHTAFSAQTMHTDGCAL